VDIDLELGSFDRTPEPEASDSLGDGDDQLVGVGCCGWSMDEPAQRPAEG